MKGVLKEILVQCEEDSGDEEQVDVPRVSLIQCCKHARTHTDASIYYRYVY